MREREIREKNLYMLEKGTNSIKHKRIDAKTSRIRYMRRGDKMTGGGGSDTGKGAAKEEGQIRERRQLR